MQLETAQMLSTVANELAIVPKIKTYKPTHKNHPCTQWLLTKTSNIMWLGIYADNVAKNWERAGKNAHKSYCVSEAVIKKITKTLCNEGVYIHKSTNIDSEYDNLRCSPFAKCVTHEDSKRIENTLDAYRYEYAHYKKYNSRGRRMMTYGIALENIKKSPMSEHTIYKVNGNRLDTYYNTYKDGDLSVIKPECIVPFFVFEEWVKKLDGHGNYYQSEAMLKSIHDIFNSTTRGGKTNYWVYRDKPFLTEKEIALS